MRIDFSKISDEPHTHSEMIANYKPEHLYINNFNKGKYMTVVIDISPKVKLEVQAIYINDKENFNRLVLTKHKLQGKEWVKGDSLALSKFDTEKMTKFLEIIQQIDCSTSDNVRISLKELSLDTKSFEIIQELMENPEFEEFILSSKNERLEVLSIKKEITKKKETLSKFESMLSKNTSEEEWQNFFEDNKWIFGYSLNVQIINGQTNFGSANFSRKGEQKGDFLTTTYGNLRFTIPVEIKKASTKLVESEYRNNSYLMSKDLVGGVGQLQNYCNKWEQGSKIQENADILESDNIYTCNPRGILVIGNLLQLNDRNKRNSFELFRRNIHNPEIITFDELFERANFIVNNLLQNAENNVQ